MALRQRGAARAQGHGLRLPCRHRLRYFAMASRVEQMPAATTERTGKVRGRTGQDVNHTSRSPDGHRTAPFAARSGCVPRTNARTAETCPLKSRLGGTTPTPLTRADAPKLDRFPLSPLNLELVTCIEKVENFTRFPTFWDLEGLGGKRLGETVDDLHVSWCPRGPGRGP